MSAGEGKGWSKGKTAATDARIANAAVAHRGMKYTSHVPPEQDRRRRNAYGQTALRTLPLEWSPTMAYVVGHARLLDGDGSLLNYRYDGSGKARGRRYDGFATVFNSASQAHLLWVRAALDKAIGVKGALCPQPPTVRGTVMWRLAYAIKESMRLLPYLYPSDEVPCLLRKRAAWASYRARHSSEARVPQISEAVARYRSAA